MIIRAVEIKEFDFAEYGIYYNMLEDRQNVMHCQTDVFEDHMTCHPLIDTPAHLGFTIGQSAPYTIQSMEKHDHTEEALFSMSEPFIVCFAKSRGALPPQAEDVRAVILRQGDVIVLARNIWHDAGHGMGKAASYYYLASRGMGPAEWVRIDGNPVSVVF